MLKCAKFRSLVSLDTRNRTTRSEVIIPNCLCYLGCRPLDHGRLYPRLCASRTLKRKFSQKTKGQRSVRWLQSCMYWLSERRRMDSKPWCAEVKHRCLHMTREGPDRCCRDSFGCWVRQSDKDRWTNSRLRGYGTGRENFSWRTELYTLRSCW